MNQSKQDDQSEEPQEQRQQRRKVRVTRMNGETLELMRELLGDEELEPEEIDMKVQAAFDRVGAGAMALLILHDDGGFRRIYVDPRNPLQPPTPSSRNLVLLRQVIEMFTKQRSAEG